MAQYVENIDKFAEMLACPCVLPGGAKVQVDTEQYSFHSNLLPSPQ